MAQNSLNPDTLHFAIDLGSVAQEQGLVQSVETVLAAKPWLTTIVLSGGSAAEVKAVFALRVIPHLHLISQDELGDPATWKRVFRDTFVDRQAEEIEKDLCRAEFSARNGCCPERDLTFARPPLLALLRAAPTVRKWSEFVKLQKVSRVTLWARYRRYGHAPSELLRTFRCLWGRKLASMGRTQAQIAFFLGQPDTAVRGGYRNSRRALSPASPATFGGLMLILLDSLRDFGHSDDFSRTPQNFGCVR